jgi:hypothetical protein
MEKIQVSLPKKELDLLRQAATRSGRTVAELVREAIRKVLLQPPAAGPVAIWDGEPRRTATEHDCFARGADAIRSSFEGVAPAILQAEIGEAVRLARKARVQREQVRQGRKKP